MQFHVEYRNRHDIAEGKRLALRQFLINATGSAVCAGILFIIGWFAVSAAVEAVRSHAPAANETVLFSVAFMLPFGWMMILGVCKMVGAYRTWKRP